MSHPIYNRRVLGWSLYDFANTIYSMNILTFYLKRYVIEDLGKDGLYYDIAYSISMLTVGILMPALGAFSDYTAKKKLFLFLFTFSCCVATGLLAIIPAPLILALVMLFAVSNFFYEGGMVFYNALLYSVSSGKTARVVSGIGVSLGYTGSILGLILVGPFVSGDIFGWNVPFIDGYGKIGAFIPTALLFIIFSIPLFLFVKENREMVKQGSANIKSAYRDVWEGIRATNKYPGVLRFLIADYFFEDAVATVIINAGVFCSIVLAFSDASIQFFFIFTTVFAMIGAYLIGLISQRFSLKKMMAVIIYGWILCLIGFMIFESIVAIYIIGSLIGVFLGGLWTVSRPLLAELVPKEDLGRFFGLYSLSGKAAAMIGPIVWGTIVYLFKPDNYLGRLSAELLNLDYEGGIRLSYRLAIFSLVVMMIIGLVVFRKLPERSNG